MANGNYLTQPSAGDDDAELRQLGREGLQARKTALGLLGRARSLLESADCRVAKDDALDDATTSNLGDEPITEENWQEYVVAAPPDESHRYVISAPDSDGQIAPAMCCTVERYGEDRQLLLAELRGDLDEPDAIDIDQEALLYVYGFEPGVTVVIGNIEVDLSDVIEPAAIDAFTHRLAALAPEV